MATAATGSKDSVAQPVRTSVPFLVKRPAEISSEEAKLVDAISGARYGFLRAGTDELAVSFPIEEDAGTRIEHIIGRPLVVLMCSDGKWVPLFQPGSHTDRSEHVQGVLAPRGELLRAGHFGQAVNSHGVVSVVFYEPRLTQELCILHELQLDQAGEDPSKG